MFTRNIFLNLGIFTYYILSLFINNCQFRKILKNKLILYLYYYKTQLFLVKKDNYYLSNFKDFQML